MWLVNFALRRPVTIFVAVLSVALVAWLAVRRMPVDIFPKLGNPTVYVAQPYGGMDPSQMEGFLAYYYEYHFLYITGIEHVESKSIQGVSLMKLVFHAGTDMDQAMAEVVGYVNRSRAFMPPGTVPPFITRFDAGSVAVGQLVFTSPSRPVGEMQDIALNRVRPLFATLEGVSAPPPFGGNQKTIVVRIAPEKLRQYRVSPEEAIAAVNRASTVLPSGNVRIGDLNYIASTNAVLGPDIDRILDAPVRPGPGPSIYLRDLGAVETATDIVTAYAHVNGKRTVYIPVTKRSDASTLRVIQRVRNALPEMQAACPEDVRVSLEFDQSGYVSSAIRTLVTEGLLGALLTGLAVILFLRDVRGALIVVATIPFSLLAASVCLWLTGQTINIMTLGGLALAVGVLVDEATVEIENIHSHLRAGLPRLEAVRQACSRTATPRLLALASVLAVFVPSFLMTGVVRQLFVPLALAVGFAMISSYLLSSTLVPVLAARVMKDVGAHERESLLHRFYSRWVDGALRFRWPLLAAYALSAFALIALVLPSLGREVFPSAGEHLLQLRLRAPSGTRIEKTEEYALKALDVIKQTAGPGNVNITTDFVGVQPPSYPINTIHLWTGGPHEAVIKALLKPGQPIRERLRANLRAALPDALVSFEPGDIAGQVMSFGSPTPIEIAVQGPDLAANRAHAEKIRAELTSISWLRDLQFSQNFDYPALQIDIDRIRSGQFGLTMSNVARSLVAATSSSRFIEPNYWRDPKSGNAFQIQVEIPYQRMSSVQDLKQVPVMENGESRPALSDLASVRTATAFGSVERYNMQRVASLTANLHDITIGKAAPLLRSAVSRAGDPPRGAKVHLRGQIPAVEETVENLKTGLLVSLLAIGLLLTAYFQSPRVAASVLVAAPGALAGVALLLYLTNTTMNLQSFLGTIMAVGIAVANAILLCSFAEAERSEGASALEAARGAARSRLRAILMTTSAMVAGMIPLALGLGEGSGQSAPLGRAVIGGLLGGTLATLTVLPAAYAILMRTSRLPKALVVLLSLTFAASAQSIRLPGELQPWQRVALASRIEGIVDKVHVDRGSVVSQGQLLVELSAPEMISRGAEARAAIESATARAAEADAKSAAAESTFRRLDEAAKTPGAVSADEVTQARQTLEAARALASSLRRSVEMEERRAKAIEDLIAYLKVSAPFPGVITARHAHPGALASPSSGPLLDLEQVSRLRLVVAVPESELSRIPRGARVRFKVPAHPNREFSGAVARISRSLDPKSRTMPVELDVANGDGALAPGMYADVEWPAPKAAAPTKR